MHALNQMQLTRIMVAHRPETINAAERVVALQEGLAIELRAASQLQSPALVA
jgi:ATP-binding cassette subfamily B protein RaxB